MTTVKHTPGPWVFVEFKPQDRYEIYSESGSKACIAKVNYNTPLTPNATQLANAKLIAAAPELLEALSAVYNDIELNNVRGGSDELNVMVQSAIKKATE